MATLPSFLLAQNDEMLPHFIDVSILCSLSILLKLDLTLSFIPNQKMVGIV
jgi:hypothetical protein